MDRGQRRAPRSDLELYTVVTQITHNRLLQAGSPWSRAGSTTPSWLQTNLLANSRSLRCNHRVALSSRNRPDWGNPCHDGYNTRPSC